MNEELGGLADKWNVYFASRLHLTGMRKRMEPMVFNLVKILLFLKGY
jgi:hypothetical protein